MTTQTTPYSENPATLLRAALTGNAIFCLASGASIALFAPSVAALVGWADATLLGLAGPVFLRGLGLAVVLYAAFPFFVSWRVTAGRAWAAIALDLVWVVASYWLVLSQVTPLTRAGAWTVAILADIVLVFAILQYVGLRRAL